MEIQTFDYPEIGETYKSAVLSNGLRVKIVEKPGFALKYATFSVKYGGVDQNFQLDGSTFKTPAGIAHYLEHKMFDMPDGADVFHLFSVLGADVNAFTTPWMTCYYFNCTDNFEDSLKVLLKFVTTPFFTAESVEKERPIITQEILMGLDDPSLKLYYSFLGMLYRIHPVNMDVAGTVESIGDISAEKLYECYSAFYTPENMVLCIEGDVCAESMFALVEKELASWKCESSAVPVSDYGESDGIMPYVTYGKSAEDISTPQFLIGAKIKPVSGDFTRHQMAAKLGCAVVFGPSSPFFSEHYSSGLLNHTFSVDVDYAPTAAHIEFSGESRDPDAVLAAINSTIADVRKNGIDSEFFSRLKKASIGSSLRAFDDFDTVCAELSEGTFFNFCIFDSPKILESITSEECVDFLLEYLSPERLAMYVIEPNNIKE